MPRERTPVRRAALPVLTALATAALLVAVQLAAASGRDAQPRFGLDLTLSTPVAAAGETVTAVVRLTMAETRPGDKVTVAGRITGGLRPVGGDPSRGTFDLPSSVWTVPTAPGLRTAVLLWRLQAVQPTPGVVEQVRVAVTSPRTRARSEADPCGSAAASPAVSPSTARASGSGAAGARAEAVPRAGAEGDGRKAAGTQVGPRRAATPVTPAPTVTPAAPVTPAASASGGRAPKDCASSSAEPGGDSAGASPEAARASAATVSPTTARPATTASAATVLPTTARPAATAPAGGSGTPSTSAKPPIVTDPASTTGPAATAPGMPSTPSATPGTPATAHPPIATDPAPTARPGGPGTSGTPAASPSATRSASPPTAPPVASPSPPPPPPPVAEVAVPAEQQCADDATAACAGLRFGDPKLRLARTADTTDTRPGQQVTHTVTVTDSGEAAALFATVRNSIPAGAPLVSGRISQGAYDALTGVWQTGRIAAGGTATLTLTLHVPDPAAGTVMSARSEFLGSADPAPVIEHTCPDDPGSACAITRVTAP